VNPITVVTPVGSAADNILTEDGEGNVFYGGTTGSEVLLATKGSGGVPGIEIFRVEKASASGGTWTRVQVDAGQSWLPGKLLNHAFNGATHILVGEQGGYISTNNGSAWAALQPISSIPGNVGTYAGNYYGVAYGNGIWVFLGPGSDKVTSVSGSADLTNQSNYSSYNLPMSITGEAWQQVLYSSHFGGFFAIKYGVSSNLLNIMFSTDGIRWRFVPSYALGSFFSAIVGASSIALVCPQPFGSPGYSTFTIDNL
jgi:hypothetical protein